MLKQLILSGFISASTLLIWASSVQAQRCQDNVYLPYGSGLYVSNCNFPQRGGVFQNTQWEVAIYPWEETYFYKGRNRQTGDSLFLGNVDVSGTKQRMHFTFRNGNYRYIVTIRPSDPNVIRLEVYQGSRALLNQLLYKVGDSQAAYRRMQQ
ncbi:hypothetical protein [Synechococcus sp. BDU 130192]|uniref:hypothetical protein n=1 Tax=Synechococcus sp. BDU 130192 TaxID=2042059 RepID=UPI00117D5B47|nr:hypothetical protein [Synechococcus sp. BDU 130192]